jgi:tRNA-splicing ligase RtcB
MSISELKGGVPVKLWTEIGDVESEALTQLRNISNLPWVFKHIAVMPDVHFGKGATVGSVIAMKDAISPAAVGVDIGCFFGEDKIILADGRSISFLEMIEESKKGIEHYGYSKDPKGNICITKLENPRETRKVKELIEIELDNSEKIKCTLDHKFYLRDNSEIEAQFLKENDSLYPLYLELSTNIDKEQILGENSLIEKDYKIVYNPTIEKYEFVHRLADRYNERHSLCRKTKERKWVRHHVDFNRFNNNPTNIMRVGFKEHFKIHADSIQETNRLGSTGLNRARELHPKLFSELGSRNMRKNHMNPEFSNRLKKRASSIIIEYNKSERAKFLHKEVGQRNKQSIINYNKSEQGRAKSKANSNKILNCNLCGVGIKSPIGMRNHLKYAHKIQNPIFKNHKIVSIKRIKYEEPISVYCLTENEYHNFALAAGVFVHNCGMAAVKTNLKAKDLPDNLTEIRSQIERDIPVGFNSHNKSVIQKLFKHKQDMVFKKSVLDDFQNITPIFLSEETRMLNQIGTLGGGNHFVELCLDTEQTVWMMLHSGSRNIGKQLAEYHINIARKLSHNNSLPDPDLAVFLSGTKEMEAYRYDLLWAQRYAFLNRMTMLELYFKILKDKFPQLQEEEKIICHHNYVSEETHFGEKVIVTRKGAIKAGRGDMGIIPGSMGTKSYIVRGLGNPESYESASHGAGRRMSRNKAKKTYTTEDLKEQTKGVNCRKDAGVLDEIPGAYKNIDRVMENQKDLVEIVYELKGVMCIKG